jgi:hypothetical protein
MRWLEGLYDGPLFFNPLRPARLGDELVADWLRSRKERAMTTLRNVLLLEGNGQVAQAVRTLAHLAPRDGDIAETIALAVTQALAELARRAVEEARLSGRKVGQLTIGAALFHLLSTGVLKRIQRHFVNQPATADHLLTMMAIFAHPLEKFRAWLKMPNAPKRSKFRAHA